MGSCTYEAVPDSFAFYDYLGHNPAKGGLRSGPMTRGDDIAVGWMGHPRFTTSTEMVLLDEAGVVRATQPFRHTKSKYSIERTGLKVYLSGGAMNGVELVIGGYLHYVFRQPIIHWVVWCSNV